MSFVRSVHHIVFSTKNREPWITDDLKGNLYAYMGGILRERKCVLMDAGGMPDHVHLFVAMHQTISIADLVRDVKSGSSLWIHDEYPKRKGFAWQTKYGAFSVSLSMEEKVAAYIRNQKEHHRKQTFQEEFRAMLDRHGFEYDERYIWE
jgi:REP element-mobilizing transposase RayT